MIHSKSRLFSIKNISLLIYCAVIFFASWYLLRRLTVEQTFALPFLLIILVRFILQPVIADRFYIPYYLAVFVFLAKKISPVPDTYSKSYRR